MPILAIHFYNLIETMKQLCLSLISCVALFFGANAQTTTTTVKTLPQPQNNVLMVDFGLAQIETISGNYSSIKIEQAVTISGSQRLLDVMVQGGRYNLDVQGDKVTYTSKKFLHLSSGGVDIEENIKITIYVPYGVTIESSKELRK